MNNQPEQTMNTTMNNTEQQPDTLAAILADMRDPCAPRAPSLPALADRIDAAAKRERDEERHLAAIAESDEAFARCARCDRLERASGNAAAMREALAGFLYWAKRMDEKGCSMREFVDFVREKTESALAAPARNCDMFATVGAAHKAWRATDQERDFADWLFDKTEEVN